MLLSGGPIYPETGEPLFHLMVAAIVISTIVIILRVWSRLTLSVKKFDWDDWTALAAWCFVVPVCTIACVGLRRGLGRHQKELAPKTQMYILKLYLAACMVWYAGMCLIRISALCFYRRIFDGRGQWFKYNFWAALALNIAWALAYWCYLLFGCVPIQASWNRSIPGYHCADHYKGQFISGISSAILDVWVLLIPMPLLWRLNLSTSKKASTIGIFSLGYVVAVCSIGRTVAVSQTKNSLLKDFTYVFITNAYWFLCEIFIAFVSICLPSAVSLFKRARRFGIRSLFTDADHSTNLPTPRRSSVKPSTAATSVDRHEFLPLPDLPKAYGTSREAMV